MSHRILVIDHHPQGLQRVVNPLRKAGYEVSVAQTAADGASSFGQLEPDLVFIAARLPRTHGTVLCRELKRTDSGARTPIVLMVEGTGVKIDLPPLDQFGADQLLQKPFTADELLSVCQQYLSPPEQPQGRRATDDPADDGLSTALEELDALDFDLPKDTVRGVDVPPVGDGLPLSDEATRDIEDRIDDLFTESAAPSAPNKPAELAPSTGRDRDVDDTVLEELDLEDELTQRLASGPPQGARPASPSRTTRQQATPPRRDQPAPPKPTPTATATVHRPAPGSTAAIGRFQTEILTRDSAAPRTQVEEPASRAFALPRWSWVAIPVTVALVAMAVLIMTRLQQAAEQPAPAPVAHQVPIEPSAVTPPFTGPEFGTDGLQGAATTGVIPGTFTQVPTPDEEPTTPAKEVVTRDPKLEVAVAKPTPRKPEPKPPVRDPEPKKPEPAPIVVAKNDRAEPEPQPVKPKPVAQTPAPETSVADEPEQPAITEPEPQPDPVEQAPVEQASHDEPPVEQAPVQPAPEPAPVIEEPSPAPVVETQPPPPEPVTRDPVLIRKVEPTVSAKELKKGGGTVVLRVLVNKSGSVTRVIVDQGIPGSPVEGAAVAAVLRWRYEPALDKDVPVEAWTTARFNFGN